MPAPYAHTRRSCSARHRRTWPSGWAISITGSVERRSRAEDALAEAGWRVDTPQPALLARFLAEHDRGAEEAVRMAEQAAVDRHDIFTEDALAWAYFKAGRVKDAAVAMRSALRTGTKDPTICGHAAAIARMRAAGQSGE